MPKRGQSRGGRGGRGGRGRGGARGGRFPNTSSSSKRRARGKGGPPRDDPELMDLSYGAYTPQVGTSSKSLPKRPHSMMDEARYTSEHSRDLMSRPMRMRPIEFVKAVEVYDPSKDLVTQLQEYKETQQGDAQDSKDTLSQDMESLRMSSEEPRESARPSEIVATERTVVKGEAAGEPFTAKTVVDIKAGDAMEAIKTEADDGVAVDGEPEKPAKVKIESEERVEKTENTEAEHGLADGGEVAGVKQEVDDGASKGAYVGADVDVEDDDVGVEDEDAGVEAVERAPRESSPEVFISDDDVAIAVLSESEASSEAEDSDHFVIDDTPDSAILQKLKVQKASTMSVIQQKRRQPVVPVKSKQHVVELEHDPYVTVGGVMMRTTTDKLGNTIASLPELSQLAKVTTSGFEELDDYSGEYHDEDSDEDAAFEDYMRHIKSDNDSDEDFIQESQHMSDSEAESIDDEIDDYLNSDEEGLEDILAFARTQQKKAAQIDFAPTQTLKKVGSGKKQRLELGSELELELRESLMEQFQYQKKSRREKKLRKKENKKREAVEDYDLRAKYDYSLHIKEIQEEFESFLHDCERETMSFPPLDGHGNKTINKLACHYNMKCMRAGGNGSNLYMKVGKTNKTFRYVPDYDSIHYITRQRPVFKRVDVKGRTKEEIAASDGKKDRGGPKSNAHVREGDVVGAEAPEIADSNIGRKLLEKLGWVKGEGLGVHGNKGISVPLTVTVKKSKTGLK